MTPHGFFLSMIALVMVGLASMIGVYVWSRRRVIFWEHITPTDANGVELVEGDYVLITSWVASYNLCRVLGRSTFPECVSLSLVSNGDHFRNMDFPLSQVVKISEAEAMLKMLEI